MTNNNSRENPATPLLQQQMTNKKKIAGIIVLSIGAFLLLLGLLLGGVFLGVGGFMEKSVDTVKEELSEFKENGAIKCRGTIVDKDSNYDRTHSTTVQYYVESEDRYYEVSYSVSNSDYGVGDKVDVYYDATSPKKCMVPELHISTYGTLSNAFFAVAGIIGIVMVAIGMIAVVVGVILVILGRNKKIGIKGEI